MKEIILNKILNNKLPKELINIIINYYYSINIKIYYNRSPSFIIV